MKKLALFDFCETLVSFQTADAFVDYVRKREGNFYMHLFNIIYQVLLEIKVIAFFNKLYPRRSFGKKLKLLQLKGFSVVRLNELAKAYYEEEIKPGFIKPLLMRMKKLGKLGYELCVVSAGYSIYLTYFIKDYKIQHLISTEIKFNKTGTICCGIIYGKDCINDEKVKRLKIYFQDCDVNYEESVAFSDSKSDLPLLFTVGKGFVISKSKPQSWIKDYNLKEIIWG